MAGGGVTLGKIGPYQNINQGSKGEGGTLGKMSNQCELNETSSGA